MSSFVGTAGEVFSREAEGQHSQDQLPNVEKFSSIGRNSLNLDIFSPLNDGKITDVASFAFFMYCPVYCHFMVPKCAFPSSLQVSKHMVLVILQLQEMVSVFNFCLSYTVIYSLSYTVYHIHIQSYTVHL